MIQKTSIFKCLFVLYLAIGLHSQLAAQFSGSTLLEAQFGNIPSADEASFPSLYNRTILSYRFGKWTASTTIEQFYTEFGDRNFTDLSQLSLRYKNKAWDVKLGNIYETLGRGMLLRSFEVKGAILEDLGFRSRNYFHRDILGGVAKFRKKKFSLQVTSGYVLNNLIPPTFNISDRRSDTFMSISGKFNWLKKHKTEIILFSFNNGQFNSNNLYSISTTGPLFKKLNYYVELARSMDESELHGFYTGITGLAGDLSYSLEYRNYNDLILGGGINEPPQVIKEQTYRMLNRSTHVSNPLSEDGYQVDLIYGFENGSLLNLNHSLARNVFGSSSFVFQQYFLEWSSSMGSVEYKLYLDYSKDPLKAEPNRYAAGLYSDVKLNDNIRLLPEFEFQSFNRNDNDVSNQYYSLGLNYKSKLNINIQLESTTDPFLIDAGSSSKNYLGTNIRYKLNQKNTLQLFAGDRRGGPACSAGVCYEILDFSGVECRWSARF